MAEVSDLRQALSIELLGNADAATSMGALEALGLAVKDSANVIGDALNMSPEADSIHEHAEAINGLSAVLKDGFANLAAAIRQAGKK
jgi:hypothetical protein